jgi:hypothetical protein
VKQLALKFVPQFLEMKINSALDARPIILDSNYAIFVTFLQNTDSLKFIMQVLNLSMQCRKQYLHNFSNVHPFDEEMEVSIPFPYAVMMQKRPTKSTMPTPSMRRSMPRFSQVMRGIRGFQEQVSKYDIVVESSQVDRPVDGEANIPITQFQENIERWLARSNSQSHN